jgi:predicted porin
MLRERVAGLVALVMLATTDAASGEEAPLPLAENSISFDGVKLYGAVDIGFQYQTHGAPISPYFQGGSSEIVERYSNHSVFGVTPNNLGQSRVGLQGDFPVISDWSVGFKLETFFNPQSGELSNGLKSLAQNNGKALNEQTTNLDTSVAGQVFQQSYVELSSSTFGKLRVGRQNSLLADAVALYDPNQASQAFSLIGLSGVTAGGGDTEDRRVDDSVKYVLTYAQRYHLAALYKFGNGTEGGTTLTEGTVGMDVGDGAINAYVARTRDGISASPLSASQVALLPSMGLSISNSLAATVSDNLAYALMGAYRVQGATISSGYERIQFSDPSNPLTPGYDDIGDYRLAFINNAAYPHDRILSVYWLGAKYPLTTAWNVTAAYYGYHQNSYGDGANAGCYSNVSSTCSGRLGAASLSTEWNITKHVDCYAGLMYSQVHNGLAYEYLHTTNMNPTIGVHVAF